MDLQAFNELRQTDFQKFQSEYTDLKTQYSTAISAAIQEQDPKSQTELIQKVLDTNKNMTEHVRSFISILSKGTTEIDTTTVDKLTAELIRYQNDYQELMKSSDRLKTLKMIQATTQGNLATALTAYNLYLGVLCVLTLVVILLAIRTAWTAKSSVVEAVTGGFKLFGARR